MHMLHEQIRAFATCEDHFLAAKPVFLSLDVTCSQIEGLSEGLTL